MSILHELKGEIRARISSYTRELEQLAKAAARSETLKSLIAEAEAELKTMCERCPDVKDDAG